MEIVPDLCYFTGFSKEDGLICLMNLLQKKLLTKDEKYKRAIFFYTYEDKSFEPQFEEDDVFDQYGQPLIKIKENNDLLDDKTKALVDEFVNKEVYDETIDFRCLKCNYQKNDIDWETIEEDWIGLGYPKIFCPKCFRPHFVPLDI